MKSQPVVVFITAPSTEIGQLIATALLEQKLAACVNIIPSILSFYRWEGKLHQDEEVLLVIKTRAEVFADGLIPAVRAVHPYDLPEIIALPILQGLESYLDWIEAETSP